ncbi:MAG TPA: hypothetical protein VM261_24510 [Kofleriaceae bacterium]|nr:hypothetical protein [Kofleriaceae bacterium]
MRHRLDTTSFATSRTCAARPAASAPDRECLGTPRHATLGLLFVAGIALLTGACGGGGGSKAKRGNTYVAATSAQEQCCEHLGAGGPRDSCLSSIVRVPDESVAGSQENQATYACVQEHFVCDPSTGMPTQESAQSQLDCIQDLPQ